MNTDSLQLRMTVYASLMAALVSAGAYIAIPIGPVPIVLQNMFVLLTGLLLGRKWGLAAIAVYLLAGGLGLPVFSQGRGGFSHFAGPTGGYLLSYLLAVYVIGLISEIFGDPKQPKRQMAIDLLAMLCGSLIIYAVGVPWLKMVTTMPWQKALVVGAYPFLIGDAVKILAAAFIARAIRPLMQRSLGGSSDPDIQAE